MTDINLKLISAYGLQWGDAAHTKFNCWVTFDRYVGTPDEESPFTCALSDPAPWAQDCWSRAMKGEFGPIGEFVEG